MDGDKFYYDLEDKIIFDFKGKKTEIYRIVAKRDIKNPYCMINKGKCGGYIAIGALDQNGECWIDVDSAVGESCFVGGDSYVVGSLLCHDVIVGNSGVISYSKINPKSKVAVFGEGKIIACEIEGDIEITGNARLDSCNVEGSLEMTHESHIENSDICSDSEKIVALNNFKCRKKKISGHGTLNLSDTIKIEDKPHFQSDVFNSIRTFV